jgi:phage FluMu protein Com
MSNKEFFSKRSNYFTDLLATLFYTIAGLLFFFISPSYSLSWNDEEWLTSGCPKTASGKWVIDSPKNKDLRFITINNNELTYIFKSNKEHKFAIENYSLISKNKFLKLKIKPINSQKETVLKIRPHLLNTNFKKEKNHPNCLIKVFTYKNERHAKTDQYSGWNIFRLIKQ